MNRAELEKQMERLKLFAILCLLAAVIFAICFFATYEIGVLVLFIYSLLGSLLSLSSYKKSKIKLNNLIAKEQEIIKKQQREAYEANLKTEKEREEFVKLCSTGSWKLDTQKFYKKCLSQKIENLDDPFYLNKAKLILDNTLKANRVPQKYRHLYNSDEKINEYFSNGKKTIEEAEYKKRNTPKSIKLTTGEKEEQTFFNLLKNLSGKSKREKIISLSIEKEQKKIDEINKRISSMEKSRDTLISAPNCIERKSDWAIMGGLAQGIAGPAAGITVAQNALIENQKIEARNNEYRQAKVRLYTNYEIMIIEEKQKLNAIKRQIASNKKTLRELETKIILSDIDKDELFKSFSITSKIKGKKVELTVSNSFVPNVPENIKMVVDGILNVKISYKMIYSEQVIVPLPTLGVPCDKSNRKIKIYNYITQKMPSAVDYDFEITPVSLWVMEQ